MRRVRLAVLLSSFTLGAPLVSAQLPQATATPVKWAPGEKLRITGIPNVGKITDQLYRGAQPRPGTLEQLKKIGITTIVDLRGEDSSVRDQEKKEAEALDIHFVSIPVSGFTPPSSDQIAQFLSLFGEKSAKIFVHCRLGEDRTGVFVATYRMTMQKWPADEAIKEMYFFGYNGFWHRAMTSYVRRFPALLSSTPALATLSGAQAALPAAAQAN